MKLTDILAQAAAENFCLYYSAHVAHVNTTGRNFVSDHEILGRIYQDAQTMIDTYAEFQQTLKQPMLGDYQAIRDNSSVPFGFASAMSADDYLEAIYDRIEAVMDTLTELYRAAEDANEYGLSGFVQERLITHKKQCWQLRAVLCD